MKNADEWSKELGCYAEHCQGADEHYFRAPPYFVRAVQADALKHAAMIADQSLVPEATEAAVAQQMIARAILDAVRALDNDTTNLYEPDRYR